MQEVLFIIMLLLGKWCLGVFRGIHFLGIICER